MEVGKQDLHQELLARIYIFVNKIITLINGEVVGNVLHRNHP